MAEVRLGLRRKVSLRYSEVDGVAGGDGLDSILEGNFDNLPPLGARIVRVFISSTFSDMIQERNALMERVYPRLKDFCREKYRLEFQLIDLRWGLREESQDDHTIVEFCLREIENCKKMSIGPSFVALLGQKYGYRPFPSTIDAQKFEMMRESLLRNGKDVTLLLTWFKKDTNVIPNVYALQPISSIIENFNNKDNPELQEVARREWEKIFLQLLHILRLGVLLCVEQGRLTQRDKDLFFASVTEYEIEKGMLQSPNPDNTSLCFTRRITNLEDYVNLKRAQKFIDLQPGATCVDKDAQQMMNILLKDKILSVLKDRRNIQHFEVTWTDPFNSNPTENPEYLKRFCHEFEQRMQRLIVNSMSNVRSISRNTQAVEILQHLTMCRARSVVFKGREDMLQKIRMYLSEPANQPLVLFGLSGSGKTSVIAKSASLVKQWLTHCSPAVVVRFLGTTSHSCSIRLILGNICWHITSLNGGDTFAIPGDYPGLVAYFHNILKTATEQRPLVIFLDSLDQLASAHKAHNLAWLPRFLPPHVHLILSTLPYEHDILDTLKMIFPNEIHYVEVLPLGQQLSFNLVREWLTGANRDLTPDQFDIVNNKLLKCSLPFYTRLIFEEVCHWSSYTPLSYCQTRLEYTVKGIINKLFEKVEKYQGKIFVTHALSYLTASKNGLSDVELEDVLSLDDIVLNDVFQHWLPPIRRIPPLLLPRLHDELSSYIMQREANGTIVFYWYHRQFIFVARERYLSNTAHKCEIHSLLANYFLGTWGGGHCKPFKYSSKQLQLMSTKRQPDDEANRWVPLQPIIFGSDSEDPEKINYNLRKLSEMPYHLVESHKWNDLKKEVLLNYNWLHAKLSAMSLHDVLSDFRLAIESESGLANTEVLMVFNALRLGGSYVNQNPATLGFDLLGRLLVYYETIEMKPSTGIKPLLQQCDKKSVQHSALLPLFQCFDSPHAMLLYMLEDHAQIVLDIAFTPQELISISKDGTIAFWDLMSGECTRNIAVADVTLGPNTKLHLSGDFKYLVVDSDAIHSPVFIYDLKTTQLLYTVGRRLPTQRRGFIVGNLLCRQKNIIDVRIGRQVRSLDDFVCTKRYVACGITPDQKYILIGEEMVTKLFEFETGILLATFPAENLPSMFVPTDDSKRVYVGYYDDCLFKVFDIDRNSRTFGEVSYLFNYRVALPGVRFLEGPQHGRELPEIAIFPFDNNIVLLNIKRSNLIHLNMSKNEAKVINTKPIGATNKTYFFGTTFTFNGKYIVVGEERFLHIWETASLEFLSTINLHSVSGFPFAVSPVMNLVATGSTIHTAIKVWDLNKVRVKGAMDVRVYECPIDTVCCAPSVRMAFVKSGYSLTSSKGYQYLDSFGIDMWNVGNGKCEPFLPFNRYGKLLQMEVSPDAQYMALLLHARETYVLVINVKTSKVMCVIDKPNCQSILISPLWEYICTCCVSLPVKEVQMWNVRDGKEIVRFYQAECPVFTLDGKYLLYIDSGQTLIVYCLHKMAPIRYLSCKADQLQVLPVKHRHVVTTKWANPTANGHLQSPEVNVCDFHENKTVSHLYNVSPSGIKDFSKNGKLAVDARLQVYDLATGVLQAELSDEEDKEYQFVQFTYDGLYVIWVDEFSVRVKRVEDEMLVAHTSTHERPMSLQTMDCGYILVLGREDGRMLFMKLMPIKSSAGYKPDTIEERLHFLLDTEVCADDMVSTFDLMYQWRGPSMRDGDLPKASDSIRNTMIQRAKAPHAKISTQPVTESASPKTGDTASFDKGRRSSSHVHGSVDSREQSPITGSPITHSPLMATNTGSFDLETDGVLSSPLCADRQNSCEESPIAGNSISGSPALSPCPLYGQKRSKSVQDMFSLSSKRSIKKLDKSVENLSVCTASPTTFRHRQRNRNGPAAALHGSGNIFMALMTDIGSNFPKLNRKKSKPPRLPISAKAVADSNVRDRTPSI